MAATGEMTYPRHRVMAVGSAPAFGTAVTLDATTDDFGWVWESDGSYTITGFRYRVAGITGTPGTLRASAQSVSNTTGLGTGTILGATSNGYQDIASHGTAGTFKTVTFGEPVSVTRGQRIAFMIKPQAVGTWDGSNLITVSPTVTGVETVRTPYPIANATKTTPAVPLLVIDTTSGPIGFPVETLPTINLTQTGTPDEVGIKVTIPAFSSINTFDGVNLAFSVTAGRTFDLVVYDNADSVVDTATYDTDYLSAGAGTSILRFSTLLTLTPGSSYRIVIKAGSGASSIGTLYALTIPASGDMAALCPGATIQRTERTDAGAWTDTPTGLILMQLRYAGMTVQTGGGGLVGGRLVG